MAIDTKALILIIAIVVVVLILIISIVRRVKRGHGQGQGPSSASMPANEQVYIGNLPYRVNERDLRDFFSSYGNIADVRIVKDRKTGRSKGYAFITFSNAREANKSLESHGQDMEGRSMVVRIAKPR